ncbi:hypothetical protein AN218_30890, partial [Streptomyces nanshensis]
MVTFAQAQERAERWVNGDVPDERHREVCVREFDLGFVAWAEPPSSGGEMTRTRLVIARDSGETTLWPGLPVGEVIRRYEEEYGTSEAAPAAGAAAPQRVDLEATSFLLTPPEWLQQAADQMGIPDHRRGAGAGAGSGASSGAGAASGAAASPWDAADTSSSGGGEAQLPPATVFSPPVPGGVDGGTSP